MRALITALRTLTRLPVPGTDSGDLAAAMPFFPAVGALIGVLAAGTLWGLGWAEWPLGAGIIGMTAVVWLTRGLHVDGLADLTDAMGAGGTRERRLAIMKDPHIGAFGVMAVVADLLLKAVALARLAAFHQWVLVIIPFIASRTVLVYLAASLPYARPEGGTAGGFVDKARPLHFLLALLVALSCCAAALCLDRTGAACLTATILMAQGLTAAILIKYWMKRHFGGVTGDLLGAANEIIETGLLVFAAALATAA